MQPEPRSHPTPGGEPLEAYDLVCTKLALPEDSLALSAGGRDKKLARRRRLEFAAYCGIPPEQMKDQYAAALGENTSVLIASVP